MNVILYIIELPQKVIAINLIHNAFGTPTFGCTIYDFEISKTEFESWNG